MADLRTTLRARRERQGLSQSAVADAVGVSRQAIVGIERGRQGPSTALALRLARLLSCSVEDLFQIEPPDRLAVTAAGEGTGRAILGWVAGRWVAHPLGLEAAVGGDAILTKDALLGPQASPLAPLDRLARNVIVAGCAPLLGALGQRIEASGGEARLRWRQANSAAALRLLGDGLVHVAGLHLPGGGHEEAVRGAVPGQRLLLLNLTRWRQGLVVAPGNPRAIRSGADLARPDVRLARRQPGSGAHTLLQGLLPPGVAASPGPAAAGHAEVAWLVRSGVADVGIAIEAVALAAGLSFLPLSEERFDLVLPASSAAQVSIARLIDAVQADGFRREVDCLPGYDRSSMGDVSSIDAD